MSLQNILNQFIGSDSQNTAAGSGGQGIGDAVGKLSSNIPGGLVGGAAAGGIMALLMGNKSARKFAGKAAKYGGAALVGGLAYKAYQNWQSHSTSETAQENQAGTVEQNEAAFVSAATMQPAFELSLIKAMIASAKADGHIDNVEQQRIFKAVEQLDLTSEMKGMIFDLLQQQITVEELVNDVDGMEQRSELYLASCLAINPDHPSEKDHLDHLAAALNLPQGLAHELQWQAQKAINQQV
jgi:uncharacterized membrane protein YebE (DUF533 family)